MCQLQCPPRVRQVHCPYSSAGLAAEEDDAMGTIFEDACMIFLDTVVVDLMVRLDETEGSESDWARVAAEIEERIKRELRDWSEE